MNEKAVGEFIGTLLHAGTLAHILHLQATGPGSYAAHTALGSFYAEIIDLADGLAENIQGATDQLITGYPSAFASLDQKTAALDYLVALREYVRENRGNLPQDSEIQNDVDTCASLINSTVYKLRFLA